MTGNVTNLTDSEFEIYLLPVSILVPVLAVVIPLIIMAVVGNALVIISYLRDKTLQTVHNMYIFNLAIADFFIGLSSMNFYVVYTVTVWHWPLGRTMCKVFLCIDFTLCLETVLLIIVISLDRLILITSGAQYSQRETKNVAYVKIAVSWLFAFALYGPAIIGWDYWVGESSVEDNDCDTEFSDNFEYTLATAIVEFVVPFVSIAVLNSLIYCKIRKRNKVFAQNVVNPCVITVSSRLDVLDRNVANLPANQNTAASSRLSRDKKARKSLALLVIVFGICWAPYTATTILKTLCESCVNKNFYEFQTWLLWCKSCVNPLLYAYSSLKFRENFKKLLFRCFRYSKPSQQNSYVNT